MARRPEPALRTQTKRCAIYTRKSTEEGLDQEFNSLDAQREACAAYILSQRHEGWTLLPDYYDDGGFSGGNMDRPGLKQLLAEVQAGRVDVIVVYKVDRLTRALSDFAKIVEILDGAGASFVSITQAFNTTTSMGRLTLNVLLSFAQFEREVISERVRDKIAASKRKGMWMGGNVPLGYEVKERKLVVNETEAKMIRHIFEGYITTGSVPALILELKKDGIRTKVQQRPDGRQRGGNPIERGGLYHILSNRLYRGETVHKGVAHPGEHEAIIDEALWEKVQTQLASNAVKRVHQVNANEPSILAGMIEDGEGRRMTPSHASRRSLRYRYYVSVNDAETMKQAASAAIRRVPAPNVERAVQTGIAELLKDHQRLLDITGKADAADSVILITAARYVSDHLPTLSPSDWRALLMEIGSKVIVRGDQLDVTIDAKLLATHLNIDVTTIASDRISLIIPPLDLRPVNGLRMVVTPKTSDAPAHADARLVALILRARDAQRQLLDPNWSSPLTDGFTPKHISRLARLSYLAPDIVEAILEGRQPASLNARRLGRIAEVPLDWSEQRRMLGFA